MPVLYGPQRPEREYHALNEILYKGRYQINYNQYREETKKEAFIREWEEAVRRCRTYPHLEQIKITPMEEKI